MIQEINQVISWRETHESDKELLERELKDIQKKLAYIKEVEALAYGLSRTWSVFDAGKHGTSYSFILGANREGLNAVAKEFLPEGVRQFTQQEWKNLTKNGAVDLRYTKIEHVPPYMHVCPLAEVYTEKCPQCGEDSPVIEKYWQAYDGPDGDTWIKEFIMFHCGKIHTLDQQSSSMRF